MSEKAPQAIFPMNDSSIPSTGTKTLVNFCSHCGERVQQRIPPGDHLPRFVCDACGTIHYQNPRIIAGCVLDVDGNILLCRRAIEPRRGFWTVPAGFMENGETLQQGAAREAYEEALAEVEIGSLLAIANVTRAHQVHVFFRARLRSPAFGPGPESLEVRLFTPSEIPWADIAFPSTVFSLERYLEDRAAGLERHHFAELTARLQR
jgi:ADP-ribose pyrophosphatase YjhB (NUDIX family)